MALISSLGDCKYNVFQLPVKVKRYNNFFCITSKSFSNFSDGKQEQVFVTFIKFSFILKRKRLIYSAISYVQVVNERIFRQLITRNREYVNIVDGMADHLAFRTKTLNEEIFALQLFGFFKAKFFRFFTHFIENLLEHFPGVSFQYFFCLSDAFLIVFF